MNKEAQNLETNPNDPVSQDALGPMAMVSSATALYLTNRSPANVVLLDAGNKIVDVNENAASLLGSPPDQLRGKTPPNLFQRIMARAESIGSDRAEQGFQLQFEKAWFEVQVYNTAGLDAEKSDGVCRIIRATDVTERKSAEFELLESEARLEEATRIARMGTYKLYWDTGKILWSHQMYDIHGVNSMSFDPTAPGYNELVHPEDRKAVKDIVDDLTSGKEATGSEYRVIRPDGDVRWVRLDGRVLFDSDGKPYATFGTVQDITGAKKREEKLKDLVARNTILTEAIQASPVGIAIVTTESENPSIFYVNSALENITGFTSSDLIGSSLDRLKGADTDKAVFGAITSSIKKGETSEFEVKFYRADASSFLAQVDIAPVINERGEATFANTVIVRDVTDDRRRADAMMESQKMEALGKLSGGVAHEINNLLQPIITLSDLGKEAVAPDDEKLNKYFDVIAGSGRKAREVVRQILTFSRQDAPVIAAHHIEPLIQDAVQLARSGLDPGLDLEVDLKAQHAEAMVNPTQVSQVVINLIRNAADAMDQEGVVRLSLDRISADDGASLHLPGNGNAWIRLSIVDTGCGISEAHRSSMFEPFFTTKPVGKGTGLGLSVVYSIVHGWGGTIQIDSEVDRGTTAVVYIPELFEGIEQH